MPGFIYNLVQNTIILILCLIIIYPKAKDRYLKGKKLRERRLEKESYEVIKGFVNRYLEEIKNHGGAAKGTTEGNKTS
tara:strand:- start:1947 stop:2180 length:234 start_codon:yes stop_codon:yes gene_type:complete